MSFIQRHDLWSETQARAAKEVLARAKADGLQVVRLSFPDLHGILRGKALIVDELASVLEDGCSITSTLLLKDTSHRTVVPVFSAGAGLGRRELQGGADIIMVPDPTTFRVLPWAPNTGWMLCDIYFGDGRPIPYSTRQICKDQMVRVADQDFELITGLEVEFHLTRLLDPKLALEDSGQPGTPPGVALTHHGHAYLTEQRLDQIEPMLEILRRDVLALGLGLRSMEVEFGPSQCEFVFQPQTALRAADDMILFRNAAKQIARRHGHHVSFMCRPKLPNVASSGWHLHQSLKRLSDGTNAFASQEPGEPLSETGRRYLGGLLAGAVETAAFAAPTINGYRRYRANSLAPDRAAWAADNRGALLRVIAGVSASATRIENRIGEPAANPYLYIASQAATGLAGLAGQMDPGPPVDAPYQADARLLPTSLDAALDALAGGEIIGPAFGAEFIDFFSVVKRAEIARFNAEVTDWEHREYFDLF